MRAWGRILLSWLLLGASAAAQTNILPDDPDLRYTEYVNATITSTRARFERTTVAGVGNRFSPGTRVGFVTDATLVKIRVDYVSTFGTPGCGKMRLQINGFLTPTPIGTDTGLGTRTYQVFTQPTPVPREFWLSLPYGADVDFLGLELSGGFPALLGPPAPRPPVLYVAYGDSITHGFYASSVAETYPDRVARELDVRSINLGFFGQDVTPADGTAVGLLGGDWVTLAIGTNAHEYRVTATTFRARYEAFLDNLRALQPDVPAYVITPTWVSYEGAPNAEGLTVEDYRQLIRDVVYPRTATDPELHLIEGPTLVPPGSTYFPDGIHPGDQGYQLYASGLTDTNLVREPGFEQGGYAWEDLGNTSLTADAHSGAAALQIGPGPGGRRQVLGRMRRGTTYLLHGWSKVSGPGVGSFAVSFHDPGGAEIARSEISVTWNGYQQRTLVVSTPASFAWAELRCSVGAGATTLTVDDPVVFRPRERSHR